MRWDVASHGMLFQLTFLAFLTMKKEGYRLTKHNTILVKHTVCACLWASRGESRLE